VLELLDREVGVQLPVDDEQDSGRSGDFRTFAQFAPQLARRA
jgi:hypothetical protein